MRMMGWGLEVAQQPPAKSPLRDWGRMGERQVRGGRRKRRGGSPASARRSGDVEVVRVLDGWRVILRHLDGDVAGDVGRAATSTPRLGLQKLARVVRAVAETRAVEGRVRAIHLLLRIALGE